MASHNERSHAIAVERLTDADPRVDREAFYDAPAPKRPNRCHFDELIAETLDDVARRQSPSGIRGRAVGERQSVWGWCVAFAVCASRRGQAMR